MNIKTFQKNVAENVKILYDAGVKRIYGFRAPIFSITEKTLWVYKALVDIGFVYSSSVLLAENPLYGWLEFARNVRTRIYSGSSLDLKGYQRAVSMLRRLWEATDSLMKKSTPIKIRVKE
jgi:hypothetical protein